MNSNSGRLGAPSGYRLNSGARTQSHTNFKVGPGTSTEKSTEMGYGGVTDRDWASKGVLSSNRTTGALLLKENRLDLESRGKTERRGLKKYNSGLFMPGGEGEGEGKDRKAGRNVQTARPGGGC